jgi:hypothetical protein
MLTDSKQGACRVAKKEPRPDSQYWDIATMLHSTICDGIQTSGLVVDGESTATTTHYN